jgi:uncharacterized membrane protein YphA (DoxX/SURF4 family)
MRAIGVGRLLFGMGFAVVGAIGLGAHDFVLNQQPVPAGIPSREALAFVSNALLVVTGIGLLVPRVARVAAFVLAGYVLLWVLALQLPRALANPQVAAYWLGLGEDLTLATGGWIIFCAIAGRADAGVRTARILFGLGLIPIGLSHFVYLTITVGFIPTWFPFRPFLAGFTGAAHIAAGLAIAFNIVPRLAATLEAVMESGFTLFVWMTAVLSGPTNRDNWVNLFISTALSAAAWAVAESYRHEPWGLTRSDPGRAGTTASAGAR